MVGGTGKLDSQWAVSAVKAAGLSRGGLERLIEEHPKVAAKLLVDGSQRIAVTLEQEVTTLKAAAGAGAAASAKR